MLISATLERDEEGNPDRILAAIRDVTQKLAAEEELRKSKDFLDRTGKLANVGGWQVDLITGEVEWSEETCRIHGVELDHKPTLEQGLNFYVPDARPIITAAVDKAAAGQGGWDLELQVIRADGTLIWVHCQGSTAFADGKPIRLSGSFQDITARVAERLALENAIAASRTLTSELASQHELLQVTLQSIGDGVITADAYGCVTWLNPVAERLTGWSSSEAMGLPIVQVFSVVDDATHKPVDNPILDCLDQNKVVNLASNSLLLSKSGEEFAIEDSAAPIHTASGDVLGAVLVFHDVTEQRRISSEMSHRASHDALTGLINRAEFEVRLRQMLHNARTDHSHNVLLFIDLDQFKIVNDSCGHPVGDRLLIHVARLLVDIVRSGDTLARLGGDEFAIILASCPLQQARHLARRICEQIDTFRFIHDNRRFHIGASIGFVPIDDRWTSIGVIMQAADAACYEAKEAGRNRVREWSDSDEMMLSHQSETRWASRLELALDDNGFVLFAQRIVPMNPGLDSPQGMHAEVLVRLKDADGSMILPGAFLPAAERFHMVSRIDRWVLSRVISWMRAIASLDSIACINVNLSGQSIGDKSFRCWALDLLSKAGPDIRQRLCLELTETAAVTNLIDAASFFSEVRSIGVRVALDDFGAGASWFGYLKTMPVDFLKIDGQFIRGMATDPLGEAAVRCFTDVARVTGMQTVAECVEEQDVLALLQDMGVDFVQGFFLHRPSSIGELESSMIPIASVPIPIESPAWIFSR